MEEEKKYKCMERYSLAPYPHIASVAIMKHLVDKVTEVSKNYGKLLK